MKNNIMVATAFFAFFIHQSAFCGWNLPVQNTTDFAVDVTAKLQWGLVKTVKTKRIQPNTTAIFDAGEHKLEKLTGYSQDPEHKKEFTWTPGLLGAQENISFKIKSRGPVEAKVKGHKYYFTDAL